MKYQKSLEMLQNGKVIVFPTDTVMGIGCSMKSQKAIKRLYKIKKRPIKIPTAVLVSDIEMAERIISGVLDEQIKKLAGLHWPGALTIILKAKKSVPDMITNQRHEIGIRIPKHKKLLKLISQLNHPIVATSANFSGEDTPVRFDEVSSDLLALVDFFIFEDSLGKKASTIIRYTKKDGIETIRKGAVEVDTHDPNHCKAPSVPL